MYRHLRFWRSSPNPWFKKLNLKTWSDLIKKWFGKSRPAWRSRSSYMAGESSRRFRKSSCKLWLASRGSSEVRWMALAAGVVARIRRAVWGKGGKQRGELGRGRVIGPGVIPRILRRGEVGALGQRRPWRETTTQSHMFFLFGRQCSSSCRWKLEMVGKIHGHKAVFLSNKKKAVRLSDQREGGDIVSDQEKSMTLTGPAIWIQTTVCKTF